MILIKEEDVGRLVLLKNNIKGKITIFDQSNMPVFVKHAPESGSPVIGSWHYIDGTYSNGSLGGYDIVCFLDEKPSICKHEWKDYLGLSESFKYCIKCDEKKY